MNKKDVSIGHTDILYTILTLTKNHNKILELKDHAGDNFLPMVMSCLLMTKAVCDKISKTCNENIVKKIDKIDFTQQEFDACMAAVAMSAILITTLEHIKEKKEKAEEAAKKALKN